MEYPYFKGLEADRYSFYRVPKALVKADLFQKMSGDAKLLYAVLLDRMSLSIKNGWQDKHGNAYIICTIEEVMDSIHCARQKAVKLLDELEHEFQLIERRRQGLCKPNLLYVKDLYAGLSQSNYWKYENHTSGSLKNELPGVPKSNGSNTEKINKTDNSETDLIYPAELQEEEQYRRYFKEALELEILEQGYPADKAVLYEILELLVETVTSRKRFLRICGEEKPKEVVKSRLMKLDSSHIQYILECLKENSTQIRNIKQYLLATLYNAPVTVDWEDMKAGNIGYLLWGSVGTGKSYLAGCIANALMEQEISVKMTNFAAVLNDLAATFEGRNEYISKLCRYPLLILDDFGMERGTEYGLEQVYNVIDSRYRSEKPLIVTTNLSLDELNNPPDTAHKRIYDRVTEMCTPVCCSGVNFRREKAQEKMERLKKLMND